MSLRIYEAFPLLCPMCGGQMRIIAFITHSAEIRHILNHIGVESAPPHITPARGPPRWEGCDAPVDDGAQGEPDWDLAAQPDEVDQRVNWSPSEAAVSIAAGTQLRARQAQMHTASQALAIERQASAQPSSAQPSLAERVSRPKTRAILGLMRLSFLSVAIWALDLTIAQRCERC